MRKRNLFKQKISGQMEQMLDIPKGTLTDIPRMELIGQSEAIVEGCYGILIYREDQIELNTGCGVVRIQGDRLVIRAINAECSCVTGKILSVEYLN